MNSVDNILFVCCDMRRNCLASVPKRFKQKEKYRKNLDLNIGEKIGFTSPRLRKAILVAQEW